MMQVFRSIAGKVAAGVFAVLMIIFVVTSVDWSQVTGGSRTTVGEIDGVRVPLATYQQMVQRELEIRQQQSGRSAGAEEVEEARNAVWDQLIADQSLAREYKTRGITVNADEIAEALLEQQWMVES